MAVLERYTPLVADSAVALLLAIAGALLWVLSQPSTVATLMQDDAYVHMVVARNLVENGTWGIVPGHPSGASSSPLFVLLLITADQLLALNGPVAAVGLAAAGVFACSVASGWWFRRAGWRWPARTILMVLVAWVGRQVALVSTGLEHTLHASAALVVLMALVLEARVSAMILLLVAAGSAVLLRPEGSVFVAFVGLCALSIGQRRQATALFGGGTMAWTCLLVAHAVLGDGVIPATAPDSALVYAIRNLGLLGAISERLVLNVSESWTLTALAMALPLWVACARGSRRLPPSVPIVLLAMVVIQLLFARVGNYFRYEAWLLVLGMTIAFCGPVQTLRSRTTPNAVNLAIRFCSLVTLVTLVLGVFSGGQAFQTAHHACVWQRRTLGWLAEFVRDSGPEGPIATVTTGEIGWRSARSVIDMTCRMTPEITSLCRSNTRSAETVGAIVAGYGARWAVVPMHWVTRDLIPSDWVPVEKWTIEHRDRELDFVFLSTSIPDADYVASRVAVGSAPAQITRQRLVLPWKLHGGPGEVDALQAALYGNSSASTLVRSTGHAWLYAWGSEADGRGPRFRVTVGTSDLGIFEAGTDRKTIDLGILNEGTAVTVHYDDDIIDAHGADRNLWLSTLELSPRSSQDGLN